MNRRRWLASASGVALLGAGAGCGHAPGLPDDTRPPRDPALWPFASDSLWNTPLGDGARYAAIRSPGFDPTAGARINTRQWSHPVFIAQADDPTVALHLLGQSRPVRVQRVPPQAWPGPMADGSLLLIDVPRRSVVELWRAERVGPDRIVAEAIAVNALTGPGMGSTWQGIRASGGSALGGLIRQGELEHGFAHVLALAVPPQALNRLGPEGKAWIWPAVSADDGGGWRYGMTGNLYLGRLLALPPEVALDSLGLQPGPETVLARALQDFGACITDTVQQGGPVALQGEPAVHDSAARIRPEALRVLVQQLRVVVNHTARSVGGGGRRRAPMAPEFVRG
ncbi:hypothetical protein [Sphaerotilus sp.]|uniref:hypothetical protein n=1 Tax=Sphaerotilus sp. TaxID=2093942 RepID=UPI002ACED971|nr:hypothetical protein [Sphaerotilus sp.]MDZ7858056.1 hypothetical protein [Sphaerotilus sp.]